MHDDRHSALYIWYLHLLMAATSCKWKIKIYKVKWNKQYPIRELKRSSEMAARCDTRCYFNVRSKADKLRNIGKQFGNPWSQSWKKEGYDAIVRPIGILDPLFEVCKIIYRWTHWLQTVHCACKWRTFLVSSNILLSNLWSAAIYIHHINITSHRGNRCRPWQASVSEK